MIRASFWEKEEGQPNLPAKDCSALFFQSSGAALSRVSGYSMVEMMVVVAFVIILAAMAVANLMSARQGIRAENALQTVVGQLRLAREIAVDQRLDVVVTFTLPNSFTIQRIDPGNSIVLLNTLVLPDQFQFMTSPTVPDTPDGFGNAAPVAFGNAMAIRFRPDGTGVDANLQPVNGSIFFADPRAAPTMRAVTVLGATGRIRGYRWTGSLWQ